MDITEADRSSTCILLPGGVLEGGGGVQMPFSLRWCSVAY